MRFEISPSPVSAVIVTQAVISVPAFVMKIFEPSITHCPSRSSARRPRRARVGARVRLGEAERGEALAGSEPRQPLLLLLVAAEEEIGIVPREVWAATVIATDESIRVSSSTAIA